jgi:predicted RNA-binding Zn-ribbon protein involved in translation (DUF1610 family)
MAMRELVCDNCGNVLTDESKELKHVFPDIPDLIARLDPGGLVPYAECPRCGALMYRDAPSREE